jgi:hypothetical protein
MDLPFLLSKTNCYLKFYNVLLDEMFELIFLKN